MNAGEQVAQAKSSTQSTDKLGVSVQTITPELARQFDAKAGRGVVVTRVESGSLAAMAGIEVGTIIYEINRQRVTSAEQFKKLIDTSDGRALLLIGRGEMTRFIVLDW